MGVKIKFGNWHLDTPGGLNTQNLLMVGDLGAWGPHKPATGSELPPS